MLVGDKADSQIYVNSKMKSAGDEGMKATLSHLPASASLDDILSLVHRLNADPAIDGILVQAPLPDRSAPPRCSSVRCHRSDEGRRRRDAVERRTPRAESRGPHCVHAGGIVELLKRSEIDVAGKHAVVIGRSDIVGKARVAASASPARDGDDLPLSHAGPA